MPNARRGRRNDSQLGNHLVFWLSRLADFTAYGRARERKGRSTLKCSALIILVKVECYYSAVSGMITSSTFTLAGTKPGIVASTRRFWARPSAVSFDATAFLPSPVAVMRSAAMPCSSDVCSYCSSTFLVVHHVVFSRTSWVQWPTTTTVDWGCFQHFNQWL